MLSKKRWIAGVLSEVAGGIDIHVTASHAFFIAHGRKDGYHHHLKVELII